MPKHYALLLRLYVLLLRLYPRAFHEEFAGEMQTDMRETLEAASAQGPLAVPGLFGREATGVIFGALAERWRASLMHSRADRVTGWTKSLFALIPFALLILIAVSNATRWMLPDWFTPMILAFIGLFVLIGLARGLPDWCLPYEGLCFGILGLFLLGYAYWLMQPLYQMSSDPTWRTILDSGAMWWGFLVLAPLLLILTARVRWLRPFYERVRADWTVLSFTLYGGLPVALIITLDEYSGDEIFLIGAAGALMLGALVYLRQPTHTLRLAGLAGGIAISLGIVALGKFLLLPTQHWAWRGATQVDLVSRWNEAFHTLAILGWGMLAILLLPALIGRILVSMNGLLRSRP